MDEPYQSSGQIIDKNDHSLFIEPAKPGAIRIYEKRVNVIDKSKWIRVLNVLAKAGSFKTRFIASK